MIDYRGIIANLTPEDVKEILKKLDVPFKEQADYLLMPTVCHNASIDDASWKLYYYFNSKMFVCYTECGPLSIFKFLQHYYEARHIEYDWYNDIYLLITETSNYKAAEGIIDTKYESLKDRFTIYTPHENTQLPEYDANVLDCFVKTYPPEWLNDGITKEAMDKFNIRYSISQNKIIIPHFDIDGRLVGIRGRALNPEEVEALGKYMPVQIENTWYKHPLAMNVYGLYQNRRNIQRSGICFVFEAEKSVLQCEKFNRPNCAVAICGSNLNKFILQKIVKYGEPREIVLCLDNEELPGKENYFNKLLKMCKKYENYANFSFIYDREGLTKLKDSPSDKGEEVFEKLLAERVKVV